MRRSLLWALFGPFVLGPSVPGVAIAAPPPTGTSAWTLADDPAALAAQKAAAVEAAVASVLAPLRPLARSRMQGKPDTCQRYQLVLSSDRVEVTCDGRAVAVALGGGSSSATARDGSVLQASAGVDGAGLTVSFEGELGAQVTRFELHNGQLVVLKRIVSPHLAVPLQVRFVYAPVADGGAGTSAPR